MQLARDNATGEEVRPCPPSWSNSLCMHKSRSRVGGKCISLVARFRACMRSFVLHDVQVAIKFIQRGEKMAGRYVEREIVNHSMLLHPHIIQFKEVSPWSCLCITRILI